MITEELEEIESMNTARTSNKYSTMVGVGGALFGAAISMLVEGHNALGVVFSICTVAVGGFAWWEIVTHKKLVDRIKSQSVED